MTSSVKLPCNHVSWYLILCEPRKERYAANTLRHLLDLSTYLPEYKMYSHRETRSLPLFPGYIFVQANLEKVSPSWINSTPGVLRLVDFGGGPQPIPQHIIDGIVEHLQKIKADYYQPFKPGDTVRFKDNESLLDLEMIFLEHATSNGQVCVLLSILGRSKKVLLEVDRLEKVHPAADRDNNLVAAHHRRVRYTRGKGRKTRYADGFDPASNTKR